MMERENENDILHQQLGEFIGTSGFAITEITYKDDDFPDLESMVVGPNRWWKISDPETHAKFYAKYLRYKHPNDVNREEDD